MHNHADNKPFLSDFQPVMEVKVNGACLHLTHVCEAYVELLVLPQLSGVGEADLGLSGIGAFTDSPPLDTAWVDDSGFR